MVRFTRVSDDWLRLMRHRNKFRVISLSMKNNRTTFGIGGARND
jgi:hypothetical protein